MTFPVIFRGKNNITQSGPQPTGARWAAIGQANETDILTVAAANFDLQPYQKWHAFAWVKFNSLPDVGNFTIPLAQAGAVIDDDTFALAVVNFGPFLFVTPFYIFNGFNNSQYNISATDWLANFGDILVDTWYLVDWWIDYDTLEIGIRINGDSVTGRTVDVFTGTQPTTVCDVRTFSPTGGPVANENPFSGLLGGVGFRAGSLWSDQEMQYLYNAGCQILYGEVDTGLFPDILNDVYAWWDMQEASGQTRVNIEGTAARDFANNGVVPQGCGTCWTCDIIGAQLAADFPGTLTDYLSVANADFTLSDTPTWHACGWVQFNAISLSPGDKVPIIGQFDDTTVDSAFQLYLTDDGSGPVLAFCFVNDDGGETRYDLLATTYRTNYGNIVAANWYFWDAWYDATIQSAQIRLYALADGADLLNFGGAPGLVGSTPYDLLAGEFSGGAAGPVLDGWQSSVAIRKGSLWTDAQIEFIYNLGCGIQFADLGYGPSDIVDGLYTFWNLDEVSGTRINSEGTTARDLLETGSVTQVGGPCTPG